MCKLGFQEKWKGEQKNIGRNNTQTISQPDGNYKHTDPGSRMKSKQDKYKENYKEACYNKVPENCEKGKNLKSSQGQKKKTCTRKQG